jgi:hypothetical protein
MHVVAHWDNSAENPANPNPASRVSWGDQTWEEMMIGFFDVAIPLDREKLLAGGVVPKLEPVASTDDRARALISQFDGNGDGVLTKDEIPEQIRGYFGVIDQNKDGSIDVDEATNFVKQSGGNLSGNAGRKGAGKKSQRPRRIQ